MYRSSLFMCLERLGKSCRVGEGGRGEEEKDEFDRAGGTEENETKTSDAVSCCPRRSYLDVHLYQEKREG